MAISYAGELLLRRRRGRIGQGLGQGEEGAEGGGGILDGSHILTQLNKHLLICCLFLDRVSLSWNSSRIGYRWSKTYTERKRGYWVLNESGMVQIYIIDKRLLPIAPLGCWRGRLITTWLLPWTESPKPCWRWLLFPIVCSAVPASSLIHLYRKYLQSAEWRDVTDLRGLPWWSSG